MGHVWVSWCTGLCRGHCTQVYLSLIHCPMSSRNRHVDICPSCSSLQSVSSRFLEINCLLADFLWWLHTSIMLQALCLNNGSVFFWNCKFCPNWSEFVSYKVLKTIVPRFPNMIGAMTFCLDGFILFVRHLQPCRLDSPPCALRQVVKASLDSYFLTYW